MDKVVDLKVSEKEMQPLRKKAKPLQAAKPVQERPIKKKTLKDAPKHKLDNWSVLSVFVFILFAFVCVFLAKELL